MSERPTPPLATQEDTLRVDPARNLALQAFTSLPFQERVRAGIATIFHGRETSFSVISNGKEITYALHSSMLEASAYPELSREWLGQHWDADEHEVVGTFRFLQRTAPFTNYDMEDYAWGEERPAFLCKSDRFEAVFMPIPSETTGLQGVRLCMFTQTETATAGYRKYDFNSLSLDEQRNVLEESGMRVIVVDLPMADGVIDFRPLEEALEGEYAETAPSAGQAKDPVIKTGLPLDQAFSDNGFVGGSRNGAELTGQAAEVQALADLIKRDPVMAFSEIRDRLQRFGSRLYLGSVPVDIFQTDERVTIFGLKLHSLTILGLLRFSGGVQRALQIATSLGRGILDVSIVVRQGSNGLEITASGDSILDEKARQIDVKGRPIDPTLFAAFLHTLKRTRPAEVSSGMEQVNQPRRKPWKRGLPGNPPRNRQQEPPVIQPSSSRWDDVPTDRYSRDPITVDYGWTTIPPARPAVREASSLGEPPVQPKEKKPRKPKKNKGPGRYSHRIIGL